MFAFCLSAHPATSSTSSETSYVKRSSSFWSSVSSSIALIPSFRGPAYNLERHMDRDCEEDHMGSLKFGVSEMSTKSQNRTFSP